MKLFLSCLFEEILGAQTLLSLRSQSYPSSPPPQLRHERLATGADDSAPSLVLSLYRLPCHGSLHFSESHWTSACAPGSFPLCSLASPQLEVRLSSEACLSSFPPRAQFLILLLLPVSPPMSVPVVLPPQLLLMSRSHFSLR